MLAAGYASPLTTLATAVHACPCSSIPHLVNRLLRKNISKTPAKSRNMAQNAARICGTVAEDVRRRTFHSAPRTPREPRTASVGVRIQMHCALETRYNRYIVVNQQLNPLQISYRPVTPVTSLSINNLASACHQPPAPTYNSPISDVGVRCRWSAFGTGMGLHCMLKQPQHPQHLLHRCQSATWKATYQQHNCNIRYIVVHQQLSRQQIGNILGTIS